MHAFGEGCPDVRSFRAEGRADPDMISGLICHWRNLHLVDCFDIATELDTAIFAHLSRLHNLDCLRFKLDDLDVVDWIQSCQSGTILTFSTLRSISLSAESLESIWGFLRHLRLPVIEDLTVSLDTFPTAPDVMSFLAGLRVTCTHDTLRHFTFVLSEYADDPSDSDFGEDSPRYHITFDLLRPLIVFTNIQSISIDLRCCIDLNEEDLLSLAASWPHLEEFAICNGQRWTESSGVTPGGFLQLLEKCRSLKTIHIKFDTRGYTETPQGHPWRGLGMPKGARLHIHSSPIEEVCIHALGVFFHVALHSSIQLVTSLNDFDFPEKHWCISRWLRVRALGYRLCEEREALRRSLLARFSDNDVL